MRICSVFVLLSLAMMAFLPTRTASFANDDVEQELVRLEQQFAVAGTARDIDFLQRFLADDFLGHGVRGEALRKADVVGRFQLPGYGVTSIRHEDIQVRVFGDCAVATARSIIAGTYQGRDIGGQFHYLHVLLKRDGHWQVVAAHSTPLPGGGQ